MCRLNLEGRVCDLVETAHVGSDRHGGFYVIAGVGETGRIREEDEAERPLRLASVWAVLGMSRVNIWQSPFEAASAGGPKSGSLAASTGPAEEGCLPGGA